MATISKSVTVVDGGTYTILLNAVPDGKTVTPVNDIQTWLHCGDIWDESYTTLEEVLADSSTLLALISSNNAVDYLVRSTEWAGKRNLIPKMTSNTTPSGKVTYSSLYTGASVQGYYAFDGIINTSTNYANAWASQGYSNEWIQYEFANAVKMGTAKVYNGNRKFVYKLQGSNDGSTWIDLTSLYTEETYSFTVNNFTLDHSDTPFKYLRYYLDSSSNGAILLELEVFSKSGVANNQTAMGYIGNNDYCADTLLADATWLEAICNSTYFESVLNVKVPTMTSDTTPSGVCSASSVYNNDNTYAAYHAFDGSTSSLWHANATGNGWIRYKFANSVKCYMAIYNTDHSSRLTSFKAQGSSDGSTFADVTESLTPSASNKAIFTKNVDTYQYYQLSLATTAQPTAKKVQFYGRA